jgi:cation diffusion facilitator family transporter
MATLSEVERYSHDHVFLGASHDANARRTLWVVLLTAVMMVGEIIAGYWTGSMALLADGFHMATHAGALSVAAIAYSYARRHASDRRFSFGTGKVGDLAGFASALILAVIAIGIAVESAYRMLQPVTVAFGEATLVAVVGLGVNLASAVLLAGSHSHDHGRHHGDHHHGHQGGRDQDNNLRAAYVHVLADALTSVLAITALVAGRYLGWVWLYPVMGIVGAIVIARWSACGRFAVSGGDAPWSACFQPPSGAGLAAVERQRQRPVAGTLRRPREMVAIEQERRALDMVERARRENESRAGAIDLLADLAGRLAIGVKVLERKGEFAIDMPLFSRCFGEIASGGSASG